MESHLSHSASFRVRFLAGLGLFAGTLAGVELVILVMRRLVSPPPAALRYAGACVAVMGVLSTVACVTLE